MQKISLLKKGLVVGSILLIAGLSAIPCINATSYKFCFVKSGDVQHRNFQGRFYGVTLTNPEVHEFGIGTFQLDLLGWNNNSEMRLKIAQFLVTDFYHQDVRIYVKTFIGCFQPTGDLSGGVLSGFALGIQVYPLQNS